MPCQTVGMKKAARGAAFLVPIRRTGLQRLLLARGTAAALWVLVAVVAFGAAALSGCSRPVVLPPSLLPGEAARIGNETISDHELDQRRRLLALCYGRPLDGTAARAEVLDQLIRERILVRQAREQGMTLDRQSVAAEVERFQAALIRRSGGSDALAAALAREGLSAADLVEFVESFLMARTAADAFRDRVTVSEQELRRFYQLYQAELYSPADEVVRLRHILLEPDQEPLARELRDRIARGEDFAVLARRHSVDPSTAQAGGDLGYCCRSDLIAVPNLADLAFAAEPGNVVGPVKTAFGWHIIRVEERRGPGVIPYEVARVEVLRRLLPEKQNRELNRWLMSLEEQLGVQRAALTRGKG